MLRSVPASVSPREPQTIRVGGRPEFLALDRRWLWATDSERDIVIRVDPRFGRMVGGPVRVPEDPRGIAAGLSARAIAGYRTASV